jgi:UDP-N-acetylglucosamine 2-epimerase
MAISISTAKYWAKQSNRLNAMTGNELNAAIAQSITEGKEEITIKRINPDMYLVCDDTTQHIVKVPASWV